MSARSAGLAVSLALWRRAAALRGGMCVLLAARLAAGQSQPAPAPVKSSGPAKAAAESQSPARERARLSERAHQDREIVYQLLDPSTHAFKIEHDYTESRPGVRYYFNVVRAGSRSSDPGAVDLDTGEKLQVETVTGKELTRRQIDPGEPIKPEDEVVLIHLRQPVAPGTTNRIRISETYTDPGRYSLLGDELIWDRAFGRPRNAILLPAGWYLTALSIPAQISESPDGRIRLDFINPRPDEIDVLLRAKRRP